MLRKQSTNFVYQENNQNTLRAQWIRETRNEKNITQKSLGEAIGRDYKFMSRLETGATWISSGVLAQIETVLRTKCNVDYTK